MKLFIDGMIFGRQSVGGISRVWEAYLRRLSSYDVNVKLLLPVRHGHTSLEALVAGNMNYTVARDLFHWPVRYFWRVPVRSRLLSGLHLDADTDIFHSTFLSTIADSNVKRVATVYDLIPELIEQKNPSRWTAMMLEIRRRVYDSADHLVAISDSTREDLLRVYPAISPDRVTRIYPAVETPQAQEGHQESLDNVNRLYGTRLEPQQFLLYVGNRGAHKNFTFLADWLTASPQEQPCHIVCVGGENPESDRRQLAARKVLDRFSFLPVVSDGVLAALYRNAEALVCPSSYEGFGLPVLEAMAAGCPVLCSDASSLPEVGGDAAIYFTPWDAASLGNAVQRLRGTPIEDLQTRGNAQVERFSWDRSTRELFKLYQGL